jgi:hypothetical protein
MMKKLLLLMFLVPILGINVVKSQCTVTPFYVHPDSLYKGAMKPMEFHFCVTELISNQAVQILPMTKYEYSGTLYDVDSFKLLSLAGMPVWADYICLDPGNMFKAGVWTCVAISSVSPVPNVLGTQDSLLYEVALNVNAWARVGGGTIEMAATPSDHIKIWVHPTNAYRWWTGIYDHTPANFSIIESSPNPFYTETRIGFNTASAGQFELKIFNSLGQEIYNEKLTSSKGENYFLFSGSNLDKGMYLYTVNGKAYKLLKN